MTVAELIASLVGAVAWPVVVFVVIWMFKSQLKQIFDGLVLQNIEVGSLKLGMGKLAKSDEAALTEGEPGKLPAAMRPGSVVADLHETAQDSPATAILLAYRRLATEIVVAADRHNVLEGSTFSPRHFAALLEQKGILTERNYDAFDTLTQIRNEVLQSDNEKGVTTVRAVQYLLVVDDVMAALSASN